MRASCIFWPTSMFRAVVPVTLKSAPVADSTALRSLRMVCTRSRVCRLVGAVDGTAEIAAVSFALLNRAGETETTPFVAANFAETADTAAFGSSACLASTTTVNGPLKPGPKPWARSS
ncbi:hypothetical protein C7821_10868 [Streptomyces sp. VMFN-G11Ma]|nr:hypothetical protein C7821_10868 [Streptomyces sp. VMFN-G11Ma]